MPLLAALQRHLQEYLTHAQVSQVLDIVSSTSHRASTFRVVSQARSCDILTSIEQEVRSLQPAASPSMGGACHAGPLLRASAWWYPPAHSITGLSLSPHQLQSLSAVKQGSVYFQSLASMLPALCLDARPGMKVLDLCAAPGGKTTLLALDQAAMGGTGHLLAVDNDFARLQRLIHNAKLLASSSRGGDSPPSEQQGLPPSSRLLGRRSTDGRRGRSQDAAPAASDFRHSDATVVGCNLTVVKADGCLLRVDGSGMPLAEGAGWGRAPLGAADTTPGAAGSGPFDRVLVDAPCSSSGRIRLPDRATHAHWAPERLPRFAALQRRLLWAGARLLRAGGTLVYSTCSVSPEENEEVVQWLLDNMHGMSLVDCTVGPSVMAAAAAAAAAARCDDACASGSGATGAAYGPRPIGGGEASAGLLDLLTGAVQPPSGLPEHGVEWSVVPGLDGYKGKTFNRGMSAAVRLLPHSVHEGFFIAKLKRLK